MKTSQFTALFGAIILFVAACSPQGKVEQMSAPMPAFDPMPLSMIEAPSPDPRVGLAGGLFDAEEAIWNLEHVSFTPPPESFVGEWNSDLAFKGNYVIQGNFNGVIIWDMTDPTSPQLVNDYVCPASQSDVSVYGDLLFVSGEGLEGRLDCGTQGNDSRISEDRLRGIRIFDISDIENPEYVANVQTCRGSHTHSVLKDPNDDENVYVYVSGSAPVRPDEELPGCSAALPEEDPNTALFRIEVIQVPLDNPQAAAIVNSPRIFDDLEAPPSHGLAPADLAAIEEARAAGAVIVEFNGSPIAIPDQFVERLRGMYKSEQGIEGDLTEAQEEEFRAGVPDMVGSMFGGADELSNRGPNQCHDITLYPEIGLAGGACEGYGLLLDITDPTNPVRVDAVADENFAYWHSATFSNDGKTVMFTDEWGGGTGPKCRDTDPMEWGANAIFTIGDDNKMDFQSYFKIPAAQTTEENCVAHNGSMIPVPDRDIMVQSWYQGGILVFDFTDPANPVEIAYHDRGPVNPDELVTGGSWSVYWYNGYLISSEIARGLDFFALEASPFLTQNEIDAANTVKLEFKNAQGQPMYKWPASFALAKAYVDQLDRDPAMSEEMIQTLRDGIYTAEMTGNMDVLMDLAGTVSANASGAHADKMNKLASTLQDLAQG